MAKDTRTNEEVRAAAAKLDVNASNIEDYVNAYMDKTITDEGMFAMFQYLVDSGMIWSMHPIMQDAARFAIAHGMVIDTRKGE